jgi:hypothetical protein
MISTLLPNLGYGGLRCLSAYKQLSFSPALHMTAWGFGIGSDDPISSMA